MARVAVLEWRGTGICPGSCGELVQGTWNGVNFLVPCPVNLYAKAFVRLRPDCELTGPPESPKALLAVRRTLDFLGMSELGGELLLHSDIPAGKGMASSTADIGAAIAATAAALGVNISARSLAAIAVGIEPTDGTVLPGITLFDHLRGRWLLPLGQPPQGNILVADLGGQVDTVEFNALPGLEAQNRANEPLTKQAFLLVRQGIQQKNLIILGEGASLSAAANQSILPKPLLAELQEWGKSRGALGIVAAHSGTVLGLLYRADRDLAPEEEALRQAFSEITQSWRVRLINGGIKVVKSDVKAWREHFSGQGNLWRSELF